MDLKQWKRWEKQRKYGKAFYTLFLGGMVYGPVMALIFAGLTELLYSDKEWLIRFFIIFPATALVGILITLFIWQHKERAFFSEDLPLPQGVKSKPKQLK